MAMSGLIKVGDVTFYQSSFTTVVNQFSALINLLPILTKGIGIRFLHRGGAVLG